MTIADTKIVQAAGNFHDPIGDVLFRQAQDVFDNPTPFDATNSVFDDDPSTRQDLIDNLFAHAQFLTFGLFFGWLVTTPCGS